MSAALVVKQAYSTAPMKGLKFMTAIIRRMQELNAEVSFQSMVFILQIAVQWRQKEVWC